MIKFLGFYSQEETNSRKKFLALISKKKCLKKGFGALLPIAIEAASCSCHMSVSIKTKRQLYIGEIEKQKPEIQQQRKRHLKRQAAHFMTHKRRTRAYIS